jgi:hypothetical protein
MAIEDAEIQHHGTDIRAICVQCTVDLFARVVKRTEPTVQHVVMTQYIPDDRSELFSSSLLYTTL